MPLLCSEHSNDFPSHSAWSPKSLLWPTRPYLIWSLYPTHSCSTTFLLLIQIKPSLLVVPCTCRKCFCLLLPLPEMLSLYILKICSLSLVNLVSNVTLSLRPALTILHKIASSDNLDSHPDFFFFISSTNTWDIHVCTCSLTIPSQRLCLLGSFLYPSSEGHAWYLVALHKYLLT